MILALHGGPRDGHTLNVTAAPTRWCAVPYLPMGRSPARIAMYEMDDGQHDDGGRWQYRYTGDASRQ